VPIINDGKVIGVIDSEHPRKNFFNDEHKRILETIASICSTKIINAQAAQLLIEKEKKLLEVDKRVAEVRLMALRAQMNPHFIFNCMNTIDNFILKNKADDASLYLNKFAKLIRSILIGSDKKQVSLKSEMDMLNNYIELENLRFEEKFEYTFSMDHSVNIAEIEIPPMLIQPYVENAIIHGLSNKKGKKTLSLELCVEKNFLVCIIKDNGIGREEAQRIKNSKTVMHESKGMRITETRFELLEQQMLESGNVVTEDLKDDLGNSSGTRIKIFIPIEID
jgi:LytS/YehU family sensor histidine kinase